MGKQADFGSPFKQGTARDGMPTSAIVLQLLDDVMHDEASVPIEVLSSGIRAHLNSCPQLLQSHGFDAQFVTAGKMHV